MSYLKNPKLEQTARMEKKRDLAVHDKVNSNAG